MENDILLREDFRLRRDRSFAHGIRTIVYLAGIAALGSAPASAADGVLEINQSCAVETGCFAGDTAGLPVTISTAGSYRLTSNLTITSATTTGIAIDASDVSLDLGGFSIQGPVTCTGTGATLVCLPNGSPGGTGSGVLALSTATDAISVTNGVVKGMGANGILLSGRRSTVHQVRVYSNGATGIGATGNGAVVTNSIGSSNEGAGIFVGADGLVSESAAGQNLGTGIAGSSSGVLRGNKSIDNGAIGVSCGAGCQVSDNSSRDNEGIGINVSSGGVVSGNAVYSNSNIGIVGGAGTLVQGNAVQSNAGAGLSLPVSAGYRENVVGGNGGGTVIGGVSLGDNLCNGSTVCP